MNTQPPIREIDNSYYQIPTETFVSDDTIIQYIGDMNEREDYEEGEVPHRVNRFKHFERKLVALDWFREQEREEPVSASLVETYRAAEGDLAPPIVVDSEEHSIIDGFHRFQAAIARGQTHIMAYVGCEPRASWKPWGEASEPSTPKKHRP